MNGNTLLDIYDFMFPGGFRVDDLIYFIILLLFESGITLAFCFIAAKPKTIRKKYILVSLAETLALCVTIFFGYYWIVFFVYLAAAFATECLILKKDMTLRRISVCYIIKELVLILGAFFFDWVINYIFVILTVG